MQYKKQVSRFSQIQMFFLPFFFFFSFSFSFESIHFSFPPNNALVVNVWQVVIYKVFITGLTVVLAVVICIFSGVRVSTLSMGSALDQSEWSYLSRWSVRVPTDTRHLESPTEEGVIKINLKNETTQVLFKYQLITLKGEQSCYHSWLARVPIGVDTQHHEAC